MATVIVNPGTEPRPEATLRNAEAVVDRLGEDLAIPRGEFVRDSSKDRDGWFRFVVRGVEIDVPGDDPEIVCQSRPWVSRRLYVDGSSWLYRYAVGIVVEHITDDLAD